VRIHAAPKLPVDASPLLHHVRQLMRQQRPPLGRPRTVFPFRKADVTSDGEGLRLQRFGDVPGFRPRMHPDGGEVYTKAGLKKGTISWIKSLSSPPERLNPAFQPRIDFSPTRSSRPFCHPLDGV
jgi:hypothetical protein